MDSDEIFRTCPKWDKEQSVKNTISSFFVSGQYLKNGLMDSIQIWHVVVTSFESMPYFKVALNSHV